MSGNAEGLETDYDARFSGIQRLYGLEGQRRIRAAHVCIVGIGGVGSWAVEALARSGIGELTLVDLDDVCLSNVNRQLHAITSDVGKPKVLAMKNRVAEINPMCGVNAIEEFFTESNCDSVLRGGFDYLLDAIDAISKKALLLARCRELNIPVITVGGAGGRRDPTCIQVADLTKVTHDRMITQVRKVLRQRHGFPRAPKQFGIECVFSPEQLVYPQTDGTVCATKEAGSDLRLNCASGYGTASFVTGAFAFMASARITNQIATRCRQG